MKAATFRKSRTVRPPYRRARLFLPRKVRPAVVEPVARDWRLDRQLDGDLVRIEGPMSSLWAIWRADHLVTAWSHCARMSP